MAPHQERVLFEAQELTGRMGRLEEFIVSAPFYELAAEDQFLLRQQFTYMHGYLSCLEQRIARFPKPEVPAGSPGATL